MPKIKHIAIAAENPEAAARFYEETLGLQRLSTLESPEVDGVYLTDGDLNIAILKFKAGTIREQMDRGEAPAKGLHHIGFLVENSDEVRSRLRNVGAPALNQRPTGANMFFEEKFLGAGDVIIDITDHPWPGVAPLEAKS